MEKDKSLNELLIGMRVKADHPNIAFNPDETFLVYECEIDGNLLYCRGENTIWFHSGLLTRVSDND